MTAAVDKGEVVRAIRDERRKTLALLTDLEPAEFDVPALPGWRIRDVVAHLVTTDRASVTGGILPVVFTSLDRVEAWNERQVSRWTDRSTTDLLVALDRWGSRFARFATVVPARLYGMRMPTFRGPAPGGMMLFSRPYDEWVHRQDIRRALGRPDETVDLAAVAHFVLLAVRYHVVPAVEASAGRLVVSLRGVPLPEWTYDLSARTGGPGADGDADARVEIAAAAFVMAAARREGFGDLEDGGALSIDGDVGLARAFLERLRV